jgi:DNA polymerase-3 subunit epsilon
MSYRYAVIDFETTGLSPQNGDRITEVAVVMVESGAVVDQFHSLVKTGAHIPYEVELLTGISNQMIAEAPEASQVLPDVYRFIGQAQLVAHNASFDSKFYKSELDRLGLAYTNDFICTLLLSRRLYQHSYNLKLQTLANYHGLNSHGNSHRALADASVTAELFMRIEGDLKRHYSLSNIDSQKILRSQKEALKNFALLSHEIHQEKTASKPKSDKPRVIHVAPVIPPVRQNPQFSSANTQAIKAPSVPIRIDAAVNQPSSAKANGGLWYMPIIYLVLGIFGIGVVMRFPIALIPLVAIGWFLFK